MSLQDDDDDDGDEKLFNAVWFVLGVALSALQV